MILSLKRLETPTTDTGNAYLNDPFHDKVYFASGSEFGNRKYADVIVVHAQNRLKYRGDVWIAHWSDTKRDMDVVP